jgi:hypothetical protein
MPTPRRKRGRPFRTPKPPAPSPAVAGLGPRLSLRKKLAFSAFATVLAFSAMEAALWLLGVEPAYVRRDPYAGFAWRVPHFVVSSSERLHRLKAVASV